MISESLPTIWFPTVTSKAQRRDGRLRTLFVKKDVAHGGGSLLAVASWTADTAVVSSDAFVIPPNQSLRCAFYVRAWEHPGEKVTLSVNDVDTQSVVFEKTLRPSEIDKWIAEAGAFESGDTPIRAQVVCHTHGFGVFSFDDISIVSV